MDEALKQSILRNPFVDRLRLERVVDDAAYTALCDALARLAQAWKGERLVARELMQDLYVLAPITRNMADPLRERSPRSRTGWRRWRGRSMRWCWSAWPDERWHGGLHRG